MRKVTGLTLPSLLLLAGALAGCSDDTTTNTPTTSVVLKNHSATPTFVKGVMAGIEVFSLVGSDDVLEQSPNFVFGGSADGAGLLKNSDGTFTYVVNHEDNYAVSRVTLDKTFKPVKGEYILTSDNGRYRLCSATLATPSEHGFGPTFITCGESSAESEIHLVDPTGAPNSAKTAEALGHWSAENAVPLPKTAYSGKTVIVIGDDDSGPQGGQLAMYVGNTGDLDNGSLYVLARTDNNLREKDMVVGQTYNVDFRQIPNAKTIAGSEFNTKSAELMAMPFGRTEDVDYRKGGGANGREIYFTATGQAHSGANADMSRTKYGRVYRLKLDAADPLKGTLEVILDGDDDSGPANQFQNPDNICVTNNYVYVQEDPNKYKDETHDAYIYQYNIATKAMTVVMELDHKRDVAKYTVGPDAALKGTWEYGALIDVSEQLGIENTFLLSIQPHSWTGDKYKGVDGGTKRPDENQASQIIVLKGLPK